MPLIKIRLTDLTYWLAIIGADIFIYLILLTLQMDYDDNYDSSKGDYWSLASMTKFQVFFYCLLQFWNILNLAALTWIIRKIYRHYKQEAT